MPEPHPEVVYKICRRADWDAAVARGAFNGSADDARDGFIHLSTAPQLAGTLSRHFRGLDDLVLVSFATTALGGALRWEPSRGGALFPHLYAALPAVLASSTRPLALGADGVPLIPGDVLE